MRPYSNYSGRQDSKTRMGSSLSAGCRTVVGCKPFKTSDGCRALPPATRCGPQDVMPQDIAGHPEFSNRLAVISRGLECAGCTRSMPIPVTVDFKPAQDREPRYVELFFAHRCLAATSPSSNEVLGALDALARCRVRHEPQVSQNGRDVQKSHESKSSTDSKVIANIEGRKLF